MELGFDFLNGLGHLDQTLLDYLAVGHLARDVALPLAEVR